MSLADHPDLDEMAAIQTLMISETQVPKDRPNADTQVTPNTSPTMTSPRPTDTTMASDSSAEPTSTQEITKTLTNDAPHHQVDQDRPPEASGESQAENAMDIDQPDDDPDDSDNETETGEGGSSRKKKGQRFFCTGYPPCNLSFTRSEHLARHIRKHTGERPFQCHCNRRFSRLDNLRQHAQTVHVNEEIPGDSLAATGTRYQRQIRTDRVRPSPKPRTSTISSTGSHSRGHSRNLSTSSIGSTTSTYSTTSDARRRPPPLMMAGERPSTPPHYSTYAANSPGDMGTPTSSTYPTTPGSPNFSSALGSPVSNASRMTSVFAGARPPGRRLSVPSSAHPFSNNGVGPYSASYNGPGPAMSSSSSIAASPVVSNFGYSPGYNVSPGDDWRRRTWHPSTFSNANINYNRPATSGLTYSSTPDAPHGAPAHNAHAAAGQAQRLPGIESFDHVAQQRPASPPKRNASPLHPDSARPNLLTAPELDSHRRQQGAWEFSRASQYPEIDDTTGRPATSWAQHGIDQMHGHGHHRQSSSTSSMGPPPPTAMMQQSQQIAQEALYLQSSNKRAKRNGWHQGRPAARTSPEDSSSSDGAPTPGTSTVDLHPAIVTGHGLIEPQLLAADTQNTQPCLPAPIGLPGGPGEHRFRERTTSMSAHSTGSSELNRLEALVAVATSESSQSAAHRR